MIRILETWKVILEIYARYILTQLKLMGMTETKIVLVWMLNFFFVLTVLFEKHGYQLI